MTGIAPLIGLSDQTLVLATHNEGKVAELETLLAPYGLHVVSAGSLSLPEPEETGTTFAANAELKARAAAEASSMASLADDSGLVVAALDGAPGIYSARWAGPQKDFGFAIEEIRRQIEARGMDAEGQPAYFACNLCLALPQGDVQHFEGRIHGTLTFPPRGQNGFGYDPIFIAGGHHETFGEMDAMAKNSISHRADALNKFLSYLSNQSAAS